MHLKENYCPDMENICVSIVICTYNREKYITRCLNSLINQDYALDNYELIVINNNSTDSTDDICKRFFKTHNRPNFHYEIEIKKGLSNARNKGLSIARGKYITYIDDDAEAFPDFVTNLVKVITDCKNIAGFGGKILPVYEDGEPKWMNRFLHGFVTKVDFGNVSFKYKGDGYPYPAGCNMTYKREILESIGGFSPILHFRSDDKFIYLEVKKISQEIYYIPNIKVQHNIDKERTSYENFVSISKKMGISERLRTKNIGNTAFQSKIFEYVFKLFGSLVIALYFIIFGNTQQAKYTILFRYFAIKSLLSDNS